MKKSNEIKNWVIYKITSPSGKVYVGKTCNYKQRIRQYKNSAKNQRLLNNSFAKYGVDKHVFEEIDSFSSNLDYSSGKEMFWIRSYMCNVNKFPEHNGMNLTDGGEGQVGMIHSEEAKQKLREAHKHRTKYAKGWHHTDENKAAFSALRKGVSTPWTMVKKTDEQKKRMSELKTGIPSKKKGIKYNLTEEERKEKFGKHNIGNSYNKGRKHSESVYEKKRVSVIRYNKRGEMVMIYNSIKTASERSPFCRVKIGGIISGKIKASSYLFKRK